MFNSGRNESDLMSHQRISPDDNNETGIDLYKNAVSSLAAMRRIGPMCSNPIVVGRPPKSEPITLIGITGECMYLHRLEDSCDCYWRIHPRLLGVATTQERLLAIGIKKYRLCLFVSKMGRYYIWPIEYGSSGRGSHWAKSADIIAQEQYGRWINIRTEGKFVAHRLADVDVYPPMDMIQNGDYSELMRLAFVKRSINTEDEISSLEVWHAGNKW